MKTFKFVLRHRPNKNGTHTIQLRITENRKSTYITTPFKIHKSYWGDGYVVPAYKDSEELNNKFESFKKKFEVPDNPKGDFIEFFEAFIQREIEQGSYGNADKYKSSLGVFKRHMGDDVNFTEITEEKMEGFLHYLKVTYSNTNTLLSYLRKIRRIINLAIEKDFILKDPFLRLKRSGEIPTEKPTQHRAITYEQFQNLLTLDIPPTLKRYSNVWLTLFYLQGARISDFLTIKWDNIQDGYIQYTMYKTDKVMQVDLTMSLYKLIKYFNPGKKFSDVGKFTWHLLQMKSHYRNEYLFGFLKNGRDNVPREVRGRMVSGGESENMNIGSKTANINKYLRMIGETFGTEIGTHTAKHTAATLMIQRGEDVIDVRDRLGHSSLKITERYIKGLPDEMSIRPTNPSFLSGAECVDLMHE